MTDFKDLKEGDKLYRLTYYNKYPSGSKRDFETGNLIKKKGKAGLYIKEYNFRLSEKSYGEWYSSKKECFEAALRRHVNKLDEIEEDRKTFKKEVKYLKKKIEELK